MVRNNVRHYRTAARAVTVAGLFLSAPPGPAQALSASVNRRARVLANPLAMSYRTTRQEPARKRFYFVQAIYFFPAGKDKNHPAL